MNPVFGARRRAEEFQTLLEADASTRGLPDARLTDLLEVVTTLRQAPAPTARPDFVSDLRSRLMLAAESALAPAEKAPVRAEPVRRSPRERRIATAVGGFAIISATASMAVAAQTALPGDTLYPLKRAIENAHAGVQRADDDKGSTMLDNASGRLKEVSALSRAGDQDAEVIADTLQDFVDQASEASDLLLDDYASTGHAGSIAELRSFTAESLEALQSLSTVIPAEVRATLIEASQVVRQIDEQALTACPSCSDLPLTEAAVYSAGSIPKLIDDLIDHQATTPSTTGSKGGGKPDPSGHQTPVGEPGVVTTDPPASGDPDDEPETTLPGDTDSEGGGKGGKGGKPDNPLDDITTTSPDDPIGDLLSGTGALLEDVVTSLIPPAKP